MNSVVPDAKDWDAMLRERRVSNERLASLAEEFEKRESPRVASILFLDNERKLTTDSWEIFISLVHMSMNRSLNEWSRGMEYLVYSEINRKLSIRR